MRESASLESVLSRLQAHQLVVVSNRQPYRHTVEDGEIVVDRPAGGLTAGLDPVVQQTDGIWVAWGDGDGDRKATDDADAVRVPPDDPAYTLKRVWLSESAVADYYYGFSNRVLWPLSHGLTEYVTFADRYWERYREVNEQFADSVVEAIENTDDESTEVDHPPARTGPPRRSSGFKTIISGWLHGLFERHSTSRSV